MIKTSHRKRTTTKSVLDIAKLEASLKKAAQIARELREQELQREEEHQRRTTRRPRVSTRIAKSTQRLNAQLKRIHKIGQVVAVHQAHMSLKRNGRDLVDDEAAQLSTITREEERMTALGNAAASDTEAGHLAQKKLQERLPFSQRRLRRLANTSTSARVRGQADQVADHVETRLQEQAEGQSLEESSPAMRQ